MPIIEIALPVPLFQFFDYQCDVDVQVGQRVWVSFQHRDIVGVVMAIKATSEFDELATVHEVLDDVPILSTSHLDFLRFIANYYAEPFGMVLKAAMPKPFRQPEPLPSFHENGYVLNESGITALATKQFERAKRQQALANYLQVTRHDADLRNAGFSRALLKKLDTFIDAVPTNPFASNTPVASSLTLTHEQASVYEDIAKVSTQFGTHLVHGVTGSGKTEVYLRLIADTIARGQQVLMLVPEIGLTPQTLSRLTARFDCRVAVSHSNISEKQRAKLWQATQCGELPVLIGTRSAIFYPFQSLGLIIVDEEHDDSYKQSDGFAYNARDLAVMLAKSNDVPAVFGSATPSLAMLANIAQEKATLHTMTTRIGEMPLPHVTFVDMRVEAKRAGVAETLISHLQQCVRRNEQALIFINRRGYAPVLKCEQCDWASRCPNCDSYQTTHLSQRSLICHHCGIRSSLPTTCPECGSHALFHAGAGTEKIEQVLGEQIPFARLLRLDRDNQSTDKQLHDALAQIHQHDVDIIIGTQLIAKGHHFAKLSTVCILDCDGGLYSADYRAEERLLQQIIQVAGRPGREQQRGQVFIQTAVPQHPMFHNILTHDYRTYAETLLTERKTQGLPPFSGMALLKASHRQEADLRTFLLSAKQTLAQHLPAEVRCLGPAPALMARRSNRYFYHLVLLAPTKTTIQRCLPLLTALRIQLDKSNRFRTRIDVDPYSQY